MYIGSNSFLLVWILFSNTIYNQEVILANMISQMLNGKRSCK